VGLRGKGWGRRLDQLQTQTPSTQAPRPVHPRGHHTRPQSGPWYPASHEHVMSSRHVPT